MVLQSSTHQPTIKQTWKNMCIICIHMWLWVDWLHLMTHYMRVDSRLRLRMEAEIMDTSPSFTAQLPSQALQSLASTSGHWVIWVGVCMGPLSLAAICCHMLPSHAAIWGHFVIQCYSCRCSKMFSFMQLDLLPACSSAPIRPKALESSPDPATAKYTSRSSWNGFHMWSRAKGGWLLMGELVSLGLEM